MKIVGKDFEVVVIVVDCYSGEICVMVGGKWTGYDGFNCVFNVSW